MRKLIIILLLLNILTLLFSKELNFHKEIITLFVFGDYCELEGNYYFRNEDSTKTLLFYPFVINDSLSFPDSVRICDKNNVPIEFAATETGVSFPFKNADFFKAFYRQKSCQNYFEYILTSTRQWGRALEKMDFIIKISNKLKLSDLSLSYNHVEKNNDFTTYYISRTNYMPEQNLIVKWRKK
ncbi:MAG: hypothetical protein JXQ65_12925 [Candidatus Marinimicrobia bacterium]|nr:hypothetical protein [Candidatus Neomarinimicrobiota bacterium]